MCRRSCQWHFAAALGTGCELGGGGVVVVVVVVGVGRRRRRMSSNWSTLNLWTFFWSVCSAVFGSSDTVSFRGRDEVGRVRWGGGGGGNEGGGGGIVTLWFSGKGGGGRALVMTVRDV